jgi:two-component system, sensor histidine kinase RegB
MAQHMAAGQPQTPSRADERAHRTHLAWLLRLRWGAIGGQAVTIVGVDQLMGIALPLWPLFAIIALELASNAALERWASARVAIAERVLVAVMAADVLLLTLLLHLTGGPSNPFNFLYLVHIALAAVVLPARWTWTLAGLSFGCFGALFLEAPMAEHAHQHAGHTDMLMHLYGMWIAFGVAAVFIVYFVTRVSGDLARREQELHEARALAAQSERLAALATLAAGAAHELSSPLSTIAVAAKELERDLQRGATAQEKSADARLIREEVARCREILTRMAADAGPEAPAGGTAETPVEQLLEAALGALPGRALIEIHVDAAARGCRLRLPPHALAQALRCVLENALHAVARGGTVSVRVAIEGAACRIEVRDSGAGMTPEVLARAGEPFFTTKEPGRGMGLGLFVSRAALERAGGRLELRSTPGQGTLAALHIPLPQPCDNLPHGAAAADRGTLEAS